MRTRASMGIAFAALTAPAALAARTPHLRDLHTLESPRSIIALGGPTTDAASDTARHVDPNIPSSPYAGVASLFINGRHLATGVAISPRHIITAAHCFDQDGDGVNESGASVAVFFNVDGNVSSAYPASLIESVTIHPDFRGFGEGSVADDLAIITLREPLADEIPVYPVYRHEPAPGMLVQLVGYGESGDGARGYVEGSGSFTSKRVGYNVADRFFSGDDGSAAIKVWQFDFDGPEGAGFSGGPSLGPDAEATLGGGDSGGPGFVFDGDVLAVFSVNNFVSGPGRPGAFGSGGGGIVLSAYNDWIASVLAAPSAADRNGDGVVDAADLSLVIATYGSTRPEHDLTGDGKVDVADVRAVMSSWTR